MKEASNQNLNEADNPKQIDSKKKSQLLIKTPFRLNMMHISTSTNHQSQEPPENEYSVQKNVSDNTESNKNNQDSQTQQAIQVKIHILKSLNKVKIQLNKSKRTRISNDSKKKKNKLIKVKNSHHTTISRK